MEKALWSRHGGRHWFGWQLSILTPIIFPLCFLPPYLHVPTLAWPPRVPQLTPPTLARLYLFSSPGLGTQLLCPEPGPQLQLDLGAEARARAAVAATTATGSSWGQSNYMFSALGRVRTDSCW